MKLGRRAFLGAGSAAAAVALGQLRSQPATAQGRDRVVNLYTSRHYDADDALYEGFLAATGIRVNLVEAESDQLIERIRNEGQNSPADILMTVDAGRLWRAEQAGLFQPVASTALTNAVPENLRHPDGLWFGLTKRARVLFYNRSQVNPSELSTYEDLGNSKWRGKILTRSSTNVYSQSLVGSLMAANGTARTEAWARRLVANLARNPQGGDTDQIRAAAAGLGSVAISNTYYFGRLINSSRPEDQAVVSAMGLFFPNQGDRGTHVNISGAGVVRTAPNRSAAVQFLEYLVTPEAQTIFASANYEYPVVSGVALDSTVAGFGDFKEDELSAAIFGRNNAEALRITDRAGWL